MMLFDIEGPEFLDFESCFDIVNSNCYSHMLQKLHSKIKGKSDVWLTVHCNSVLISETN